MLPESVPRPHAAEGIFCYSRTMAKRKFVDLAGAEGRPQYTKTIQQIIKDGVCPFCSKNFLRYHTRPILRTGKHWLVTENANPYQGSRHHYLFVHTKHVESIATLSPIAFAELKSHIVWLQKKYNLKGGSLFMRFGDTRLTSASVAHVHAQMIVGAPRGKNTEPLAVTLAYKKKGPRA